MGRYPRGFAATCTVSEVRILPGSPWEAESLAAGCGAARVHCPWGSRAAAGAVVPKHPGPGVRVRGPPGFRKEGPLSQRASTSAPGATHTQGFGKAPQCDWGGGDRR